MHLLSVVVIALLINSVQSLWLLSNAINAARSVMRSVNSQTYDSNDAKMAETGVEAERLSALWGIPDASARVGQLFHFPIPPHAFSGSYNDVEAYADGLKRLPSWLHFNKTSRVFQGIPDSPGSVLVTVMVTQYHHEDNPTGMMTASTDFLIQVQTEDSDILAESANFGVVPLQQLSDSQRKPLCNFDENTYRGTLVINSELETLSSLKKIRLVHKMADFLQRSVFSLRLKPSTGKSSLLDSNIVVAGPGNADSSSNSGVHLSWIAACGDFKGIADLAQVLEHNIMSGRITDELGFSVIGWHISEILPPEPIRKARAKRQAINPTFTHTLLPSSTATVSVSLEITTITQSLTTTLSSSIDETLSPSFSSISSLSISEASGSLSSTPSLSSSSIKTIDTGVISSTYSFSMSSSLVLPTPSATTIPSSITTPTSSETTSTLPIATPSSSTATPLPSVTSSMSTSTTSSQSKTTSTSVDVTPTTTMASPSVTTPLSSSITSTTPDIAASPSITTPISSDTTESTTSATKETSTTDGLPSSTSKHSPSNPGITTSEPVTSDSQSAANTTLDSQSTSFSSSVTSLGSEITPEISEMTSPDSGSTSTDKTTTDTDNISIGNAVTSDTTTYGPDTTSAEFDISSSSNVTSVRPVTTSSSADTTSAGPDPTSAGPDITSAGTDITSAGPDPTSAGPDITSAGTDITSAGPDITSAGTDITLAGPDTTSAGPDITSAVTDITSAGTDIASAGPDATSAGTDITSVGPHITSADRDFTSPDPESTTDKTTSDGQTSTDFSTITSAVLTSPISTTSTTTTTSASAATAALPVTTDVTSSPSYIHSTTSFPVTSANTEVSSADTTRKGVSTVYTSTLTSPVTSEEGLSSSASITTAILRRPPILLNSLDDVTVNVGTFFSFEIPQDTFFDLTDGSVSNLTINIVDTNGQVLPPSSWVQFDPKVNAIFGLPLLSDVTAIPAKFIVAASNSANLTTTDTIQISISTGVLQNTSHIFQARFAIHYENVVNSRLYLVKLLLRLGEVYGEEDPYAISVIALKAGSVDLSWANNTIPSQYCDNGTISEVYRQMVLESGELNPNFVTVMGEDFLVISASVTYLGACVEEKRESTEPTVTTEPISVEIVLLPVVGFLLIIGLALGIYFWCCRCNRRCCNCNRISCCLDNTRGRYLLDEEDDISYSNLRKRESTDARLAMRQTPSPHSKSVSLPRGSAADPADSYVFTNPLALPMDEATRSMVGDRKQDQLDQSFRASDIFPVPEDIPPYNKPPPSYRLPPMYDFYDGTSTFE